MMYKNSFVTILFYFIFSKAVYANAHSFKMVASEIIENSNAILSDDYQLKSKEYESQIASNYWLPTLYLDGNL
ncbi:MAG: hypothetical protein ACKO6C_06150, partial [Alphaproteobacteria bacterium]